MRIKILVVGIIISFAFSGIIWAESKEKEELLSLLEEKIEILEGVINYPLKELKKIEEKIKKKKSIAKPSKQFFDNIAGLTEYLGDEEFKNQVKLFEELNRLQLDTASLEKMRERLKKFQESLEMVNYESELYFTVVVRELIKKDFFNQGVLSLILKKEKEKMSWLKNLKFVL